MAAVPRTVDGMDVDAYVRKYSTEMGSQIRRVERRVTRALSDTSPPKDADDKPRRDNRKQTTKRQRRGDVRGIDVSGWQKNVNWKYWWNKGKRFAYVKATEGTGYKNPYYSQQYNGSRRVGMIRGAYHFALPNRSSGAAQAVYFITNGGGWSRDGKTLPGALDLEWNPYGPACYGKSKGGMRAWIKAFHDTYKARTGRWPVIYTSTSWWSHCVGGGHGFGKTVPLWVARYSNNVGALPPGWSRYTFWQYSSDPIDQNKFNGRYARLQALANGR
ncbi:lysozyme [Haloechinothrix salitolerans]|uniref:Lysozyme n=1 Tax=Haloechinothrix salitolerans TaxID=926830 RepID=A0ABW2C6U3_9PSEU